MHEHEENTIRKIFVLSVTLAVQKVRRYKRGYVMRWEWPPCLTRFARDFHSIYRFLGRRGPGGGGTKKWSKT